MRTEYDGPIAAKTIRVGGRSVVLVRPADPDQMLEAPSALAWNARDDYMPYWAYLWPGALLLAEAVAARTWVEETVLELGCGLGLAGLVALAGGARVCFTDYDAAPLEFVRRSVAANGLNRARFEARTLDWRVPPSERYEVILGADVLYERRLVPLVTGAIAALLAPGGEAWVAGPYRVATEDLPGWLDRLGLVGVARPITARGEGGEVIEGTLHVIRRRGES